MDLILYIFFFHSEAKGRTESQFIILVPSTITRNEWRTQLLFQKLKCFKPLDDLQENCKIAIKTFLVQLEGQLVYKSMDWDSGDLYSVPSATTSFLSRSFSLIRTCSTLSTFYCFNCKLCKQRST